MPTNERFIELIDIVRETLHTVSQLNAEVGSSALGVTAQATAVARGEKLIELDARLTALLDAEHGVGNEEN